MISKVYIETHGCQMNVADSERAATGLRKAGYEIAESVANADVVLLNTCSVRERAEQKVFNRIGEIREAASHKKPVIGVMGCVAQLEGETLLERSPDINIVIGTQATDRIASLLKYVELGKAKAVDLDERREGENWDISPVERHSPHVAFVPIIEGCNKFCSFCIVPYSRGREKSRTATDIIEEIQKLIGLGYQEVHLIGQNVNSYRPRSLAGLENFPGSTPFCRLLRAVAKTGMPRIKFTTSFPRDFHADIVAALEEHPNLCNWVHLPVQSGSDRILKAMRRGHKVADYLDKISAIKKSSRRLSLTSDIIVGFPGETEADFEDTMNLVRQSEYDSLYIFKYSQRRGTPAAKLSDDVSAEKKRERFLRLENLQREIQNRIYQDYVGRKLSVLVERPSTRGESDMSGHSTCHKVVNFRGDRSLEGKIVDVRITAAKSNSLYGNLS